MSMIEPGSVIGIVGGGQLGRMIAQAASTLGYLVCIYTDQKQSCASHVADRTIVADYDDLKSVEKFAKLVDVVTFEFENIPHKTIEYIESLVPVRPNANSLHVAQNRLREKDFINSIGLNTVDYAKVTSAKTLKESYASIPSDKAILKTLELGYDGKGQHIIDENSKLDALWKEEGLKTAILESFIDFEKEVSVIVARLEDGSALPFTPAENIHCNGILDVSKAPADIDGQLMQSLWDAAHLIADELELVGVLAVEFFLTKDQIFYVNEIAPRPHNSGHWTMDACVTSQFEQHVRAVCNLPLGSSYQHSPAIMKNLIGDDMHLWRDFITDPDSKIHLYGKKEVREGRKMGHVNHLITDDYELIDDDELE